jgi:hypothetical protein
LSTLAQICQNGVALWFQEGMENASVPNERKSLLMFSRYFFYYKPKKVRFFTHDLSCNKHKNPPCLLISTSLKIPAIHTR